MCFWGFAREMCHENKYTIPKRHLKQMDNVNTLYNRYILRGDNQVIYKLYYSKHDVAREITAVRNITNEP